MKGMKGVLSFVLIFSIFTFFVTGTLLSTPLVYGDENKKDLPPRAIEIAPAYPGVVLPAGENLSVDVDVYDKGRADENINLSFPSVPKGWKASLKTYSFEVTGIHLQSDSSKSLTLKAEPDKDVGPGTYVFEIKAQTQDGALTSTGKVTVTVKPKAEMAKSEDLVLTTSYPVLKGPTDTKFEFSVEVKNNTDKDGIFNLNAQAPENWDVNFKPAYEDKFFSSLRIKAGQSQTMAVAVNPYALAEPGEYPIKINVSSDIAKAEAELHVILTGTYKLDAATSNGLLSLNAVRGEPANLSFFVKNSGSASQNNIHFLSFKPENWKVEFKPESIDTLAPGALKQIELTVTPSEQALVGDYSVAVRIEGEKVNKNLELRTTVKASTAWGWLGIGIIVLVVAGLVVLFIGMGRR
jgi:uncharacterized membrane protein